MGGGAWARALCASGSGAGGGGRGAVHVRSGVRNRGKGVPAKPGAEACVRRTNPAPLPVRSRLAAPLALASLALLLLPAAASAQRVAVSGFVRDAETGETLISANVAVAGTQLGAVTNTSGFYTISGVAAGRVTLVVSYIGYRTARREVTVADGQDVRVDVEVQPEARELSEVEVTGDRQALQDARRVGVAQLSTETIKSLPSVLEPDVFRSLQLLPGIKPASDFSSGLYVRGGSPDQTLILLDRTTVYNPTHFFGFFSTFNPDAIKDVRVYKGGYPAEYGGRLGAVIDIYNKDGNRRALDGSLSVGLLASRALIEGPLPVGKGSFMLAARRSTLEPLLAALQSADIDGLPERFYFYDVNGKVNVDADASNRLSASFYAGRDFVRVPFLEDAEVRLIYGNRTGSLNWTHLFSPRLFSTFTFTGSHYFSRPTFYLSGTEFARPGTITDLSVKGDFEYTPSERHRVTAGFWTGDLNFKLDRSFDGEVTFSPRVRAAYASAYVQERFRPTPNTVLEGGLRGQYFNDGKYVRLEPRVNVEHTLPSDRVRLQLGYGRYYQFLSLITSELFSGADFWLTAADGVPPSFGDQFVAGVKLDLPVPRALGRLRFDVDGYYRTMRDLFELDPFIQDPAGLDYQQYFRFGDGYAYGTEFFLEGRLGRFEGFSGYTYSVTRRRYPNVPEPGQSRYYAPKYDRTHDGNLVLNYRLGRGWKTTSVFTYATGQAYSRVNAQYRFANSPFQSTNVNTLVSAYQRFRLPAYHRLDLGFSKTGGFFGFADYELQLQVINAYGRKNVWFYVESPESDGTFQQETVRQIPIQLPNVSLTINF